MRKMMPGWRMATRSVSARRLRDERRGGAGIALLRGGLAFIPGSEPSDVE